MSNTLKIVLISTACSLIIFTSLITIFKNVLIDEFISFQLLENRAKLVAEREMQFSNDFAAKHHSAVPDDFITASQKSTKAVVFIRTFVQKTVNGSHSYDTQSGSGVIINSDGYIITNYHVVEGSEDIEVVLNDKREFKARLVGSDPQTDLALLRIQSDNLPIIIMGNSDSIQVGQWVLAVGNPFRLQSTVTAGVVSAKGRNINVLSNNSIESFIQTDAAVNPGNSGGALVDTEGRLVGINTAIISDGGRFEGFSFAIPVNLVRKIVNDFIQYGAVQRGWLGVELQNVDQEKASKLTLPSISGVYISLAAKGSAAAEAGLRSGDVLLTLEDQIIKDVPQFIEKIGMLRPGDKVTLSYIRDGVKKSTIATLRNQQNSIDLVAIRRDPILKKIGLEIRDLDSYEKSKFSSGGVMVVSVQRYSIIGRTNLEPGLVITKANNLKIGSASELIEFLEHKKGTVVFEGFYENYPGEYPYTFVLD
jgi:serine protease Do